MIIVGYGDLLLLIVVFLVVLVLSLLIMGIAMYKVATERIEIEVKTAINSKDN